MHTTPSALPRLRLCLGSVVLPNASQEAPSMARGTAKHAYLQALTNGTPRAVALSAVPEEWRADAAAMDVDALPPLTSASAEVALAWHVATDACRVLGVGLTREAARVACRPGEMPMVVDRLGAASPTSGVVVDWKTGWQEDLAPAAEHWQLLTYAAVALLAYGWDEVTAALCRVDASPPRWDSTRLDWLGAGAHLARVRALLARAEAAQETYHQRGELPTLRTGKHCAWCPARLACPGRVGAAVSLLRERPEAGVAPLVLSLEEAGAAWERAKLAEEVAREVRLSMEQVAREAGGLPLPGGGALVPVEESEESMDAARVEAWLLARYGSEVAEAVVTRRHSATWATLKAALREKVLPMRRAEHEATGAPGRAPTLASLERDVREQLRLAGAVEVTRRAAVRAQQALPAGAEEVLP